MLHIRPALAAALLASSATGVVHAQTAMPTGEHVASATAVCQPSLPAFEGVFRKRPLAVQNEGTAPGFVSCSLVSATAYGGSIGTTGVQLTLVNNGGDMAVVDCTFVIGNTMTTPVYHTRRVVIAPGSTNRARLEAQSVEPSGRFHPDMSVNASCQLPPGIGIGETYVWWDTWPTSAT